MNLFKNINKDTRTASLVENGLSNVHARTRKEVMDCIFILADVMREAWRTMTIETAAGLVLVVLAKNAMLKNYLNAVGWDLVLDLVKANPDFAEDIATGTLAEINLYQAASLEPVFQRV